MYDFVSYPNILLNILQYINQLFNRKIIRLNSHLQAMHKILLKGLLHIH